MFLFNNSDYLSKAKVNKPNPEGSVSFYYLCNRRLNKLLILFTYCVYMVNHGKICSGYYYHFTF